MNPHDARALEQLAKAVRVMREHQRAWFGGDKSNNNEEKKGFPVFRRKW